MIYIYNCYGGTHSSIIAAAIHLKRLPSDRVPSKSEILNTEYFNRLNKRDWGRIICHGADEEGNKVFTMGRGASKIILPCMESLITVISNEYGLKDKVILSNMSPCVTFPMTIGGFLSRCARIDLVGVPLLLVGTRQAYKKIVDTVNFTKSSSKSFNGPVLVLMNKN